ncbi:MAG TPA: SDR family NAD(P)-dependent oxidoreductase, partial [Blastocatellia bacterium]|nr:SDR family NAD(P)-dependent oxidoreductase [Blastocatellia bacterium]
VSYFCNFHGPSLAVDTMCSSSLTAIHLACQSLIQGDCELAIAGGVNVSVHPNKYLALSQAQFASSSGRCESFGDGGDGYVPGEGVGAVLLKPLSRAIADEDHIYGVIKGSNINHGGKTNGYTVPNPNAQCDVIMAALEKAQVDPRTISYIEAHGTGTLLGDPIEIAGLTRAFNQLSGEQLIQTCAIGSVKSNVGHCESAAGIAGVTKVLLQMRHGELAPSLHSQRLNPHIDFSQTPFRVQQNVEEWKRPKVTIEGSEREYPRIAGISSFGAGGANAHLIIEEYVRDENRQRAAQDHSQTPPVVVPISAKSDDRLQAYVEKLLKFLSRMISESNRTELNLMDVAYTLQTGREPMEYRVAFLTNDLTDLIEKMGRFVSNRNDLEGIYHGRATDDGQDLLSDEDVKESVITKWVLNRRLDKLAEFWVKGLRVDWRLPVDVENPMMRRPRRISLPAYPFDQRRCWAPLPKHSTAMANGAIADNAAIGGMIKRIVPAASLDGKSVVVFETQLAPQDRVLDHHRVEAQRILPGIAYLEMAIEAAKYTFPDRDLVLKDVVWMQPLPVREAAQTVITELEPHDNEVRYEISSIGEGRKQIHARGILSHAAGRSNVQSVDLAAIRGALALRWEGEAGKQIFYREYQKRGIEYGSYFQGVQALWGSEDESLGIIELPKEYQEDLSRYYLPIGLVDSALQCIGGIGLADDRLNADREIHLPYSIGRFEIYQPLESRLFAHVKRVENCRYEISLLDSAGRLILAAHDFMVRPVNSSTHQHNYINRWYPRNIAADSGRGDKVSGGGCLIIHRENDFRLEKRIGEIEEGSVSICLGDRTERRGEREWAVDADNPADIASIVRGLTGIKKVYFLAALVGAQPYSLEPALIEEEQEYTVLSWFRCLKALIDHGSDQETLEVVVVTQDSQVLPGQQEINAGGGGLSGLTQTLAKEYPHWKVRCIDLSKSDLEGSRDPQWIIDYLRREPASITGFPVAYRDGLRYENQIRPLLLPKAEPAMFKNGGVYLIIGGAGGLGRVTAEYLVDRYQAHVVWLGRRRIDEEISQSLESFAGKPGTVEYIQADLTNEAELKRARDVVKGKYRRINGVIHSALVLRDQSLRGIDEDRFKNVLDPKVRGSAVLGAVFRDEDLDWLCFYSSIQSFYGAAGQGNYAAGCTFKDTYAEALRKSCSFPVFVINWGYWGSVGIVASESYRSKMEALGIGSLEPRDGMTILESVGANQIPQLLAIKLSPAARGRWGIGQQGEELYATTQGSYFEPIVNTLESDSAREKLDSSRFEHSDAADTSLNRYVVNRLLSVMKAMGLESILTAPKDTRVIKEELEISGKQDLLFDEVLRILRQEGMIAIEKGVVRLAAPRGNQMEAYDADRHKADILSRYSDLSAHLALADACLQSLPQVLRGRVLATDVLFPNSSTALVEGIYKKNAYADYFNDQIADAVETFIQAKLRDFPDGVKVRILEIGAGTGGTSEGLFKRLRPYESCVEYVYTDISKRFLIHAQEQYSPTTPYLSLQLFDVERPLSEQSIRRGSFDITIAANVLHATKNIGDTLRNVKACLKRNGLLILNEIGSKRPFTTLTFGLLDGWWRAEDKEVRIEGSPALSPTRWERCLTGDGFEKVFVAPVVSDLAQQYVIVAESNGQAQQEKAAHEIGMKGQELRSPNSTHNNGGARGAKSSPRAARPAEKTEVSEEQLRRYLEESLLNAVAEALKLADGEIDPSAALSDLGVDSIIAVELVRAINESLGLALKTTVIFDYPSIGRLAEHLHLEYKDELMPQWSRRNPDATPADSRAETFRLQERRNGQAVDLSFDREKDSEEAVKSYLEEALLTNVAEVLKLSAGDLDLDKALSDVGVDSIVAVDLVRSINEALGLSLKTTVIFDYFSIRLLTEHIYRDHRADLGHGLENGMAFRSRVVTSDDADRQGREFDLGVNDDHLNTIADELMHGRLSLEETLERLRN